jgi:hypothetical protein
MINLTQDEVRLAEGLWLKSGFDLGAERLYRYPRGLCRQRNNIRALTSVSHARKDCSGVSFLPQ